MWCRFWLLWIPVDLEAYGWRRTVVGTELQNELCRAFLEHEEGLCAFVSQVSERFLGCALFSPTHTHSLYTRSLQHVIRVIQMRARMGRTQLSCAFLWGLLWYKCVKQAIQIPQPCFPCWEIWKPTDCVSSAQELKLLVFYVQYIQICV